MHWFSFKNISQEMGIPIKSIYLYHERGDGPRVHKFGKHLRVLETDLRLWQEKQEVKKSELSTTDGHNQRKNNEYI